MTLQTEIKSWAKGAKNFDKVLTLCDQIKSTKNKKLAILAPSYLMHSIDYQSLIDDSSIDTMTLNNGYHMPGTQKCEWYLPFTTANKTRSVNNRADYTKWLNGYKGLVMHGLHHNDGTNATSPYPLASHDEVKEIVRKCPNTKFSVWHHSWGSYIKKRGVPGMLECPFFEDWTARKIPWGHCGALSGFGIPIAMALGYKEIYLVGMGYKYVVLGYHNPPKNNKEEASQKKANDNWLQFADKRFSNQAATAKQKGIVLKVGPDHLIEPELKNLFEVFKSIKNI